MKLYTLKGTSSIRLPRRCHYVITIVTSGKFYWFQCLLRLFHLSNKNLQTKASLIFSKHWLQRPSYCFVFSYFTSFLTRRANAKMLQGPLLQVNKNKYELVERNEWRDYDTTKKIKVLQLCVKARGCSVLQGEEGKLRLKLRGNMISEKG